MGQDRCQSLTGLASAANEPEEQSVPAALFLRVEFHACQAHGEPGDVSGFTYMMIGTDNRRLDTLRKVPESYCGHQAGPERESIDGRLRLQCQKARRNANLIVRFNLRFKDK